MDQRGARWLAHELHEIGADDPDAMRVDCIVSRADNDLPRYPITDCMGERSRVALWRVMVEFGLTGKGAKQ